MLKALIDFIVNPITLAILGILGTVSVYYAQKKEADPRFEFKDYRAVTKHTGEIANLEVTFENKSVKVLTQTTITVKNKGKKAIRENDLSKKDPPRFILADGFRMLAYFVKATKAANNCQCIVEGNTYIFTFDYLNPEDEVELVIWHDAESSKYIRFEGETIDCKQFHPYSYNSIAKKWILGALPFMLLTTIDRAANHPVSRILHLSSNQFKYEDYGSWVLYALYMVAMVVGGWFMERPLKALPLFEK